MTSHFIFQNPYLFSIIYYLFHSSTLFSWDFWKRVIPFFRNLPLLLFFLSSTNNVFSFNSSLNIPKSPLFAALSCKKKKKRNPMACSQFIVFWHRNLQTIIFLLLLFISGLTHVRLTAEGKKGLFKILSKVIKSWKKKTEILMKSFNLLQVGEYSKHKLVFLLRWGSWILSFFFFLN